MTISAASLREGQQILVTGKISFSRLAALVEGPALVKSIEQSRARGAIYPTLVPHTTINLVDAEVVVANPASATPEEQYTHEKIYVSKTGDNAGKNVFSIDNKSAYLPTVLEQDPTVPGSYRQLVLERDLASGLSVTLVLEVFKAGDNANRGLGLQQVVLNEAVRYFASGGVDTSALAARGIVINGAIRSVSGADSAAAAAAFANEAELSGFIPANSELDANGYPAPTPGALGVVPAPSLAASTFPLSTPVVAQAPVLAPVQLAAPVETPEQQIARLQAQISEQAAAAAGSGGASAFAAPVAAPTPWAVGTPAPAYQG